MRQPGAWELDGQILSLGGAGKTGGLAFASPAYLTFRLLPALSRFIVMFATVAHFSLLLAQAASPAAAPAGAQVQPQGPTIASQAPFFIFIAVIFYFVLIRPQQKRAKEQAALLSSVKTGDEIVTSGGLHGIVTNAREAGSKTVLVKFAENVKIEVDRTAITSVKKPSEAEAETPVVVAAQK